MPDHDNKKQMPNRNNGEQNQPDWDSLEGIKAREDAVSARYNQPWIAAGYDGPEIQRAAVNAAFTLNNILGQECGDGEIPKDRENEVRSYIAVLLFAEAMRREEVRHPNGDGPIAKMFAGMDYKQITERAGQSAAMNKLIDKELPKLTPEALHNFLTNDGPKHIMERTLGPVERRADLLKHAKEITEEPMNTLYNQNREHVRVQSDVLRGLTEADKGVMLGSKEYSDVIKNMKAFMKIWDLKSAVADPKRWITYCDALDKYAQAYLKTKQDENGSLKADLSATTMKRVQAVNALRAMVSDYKADLTRAVDVQSSVLRGESYGGVMDVSSGVAPVTRNLSKDTINILRIRQEMKDITTGLRFADKGVTFGTELYSDAMADCEKAFGKWDPVREAENPEKTIKEFRDAMSSVNDYLAYKGDPAKLSGTAANRVAAMTRAKAMLADKIADMERTYGIPKEKPKQKNEAEQVLDNLNKFFTIRR